MTHTTIPEGHPLHPDSLIDPINADDGTRLHCYLVNTRIRHTVSGEVFSYPTLLMCRPEDAATYSLAMALMRFGNREPDAIGVEEVTRFHGGVPVPSVMWVYNDGFDVVPDPYPTPIRHELFKQMTVVGGFPTGHPHTFPNDFANALEVGADFFPETLDLTPPLWNC